MPDSITFAVFNRYYGKQKQQMLKIRLLNTLIRFPTSLSMRHLETGLATLQGVKPQGVWIIQGRKEALRKEPGSGLSLVLIQTIDIGA